MFSGIYDVVKFHFTRGEHKTLFFQGFTLWQRDIDIFHVYHSHQYIVFFISVVIQLLKLVPSVAVKINKREWNPDCTVYDES